MMWLKEILKRLLFTPLAVPVGKGSILLRPWWIAHPHRIRIGSRCRIGKFAALQPVGASATGEDKPAIVIGDDVYIGGYCQIHALSRVEIGSHSVLSEHVYLSDVAHGLDPTGGPIMSQPVSSKGPVIIGESCFLGYRVSVLPGVKLGEHCVVGTGSVVTKSFPAYSMVAGNPARLVKAYDRQRNEWVAV